MSTWSSIRYGGVGVCGGGGTLLGVLANHATGSRSPSQDSWYSTDESEGLAGINPCCVCRLHRSCSVLMGKPVAARPQCPHL